jgi:DNA-binding NarL/FixJ family response regulator
MNKTPAEIRVAVVEDREEERDYLVKLMGSSPGFVCVASCDSGEEAARMLPARPADVVLMDINMPIMSGIECVRELRPLLPQTQFMMLTVVEDYELIFQSIVAGATGYLLKMTPPPKLLEAVRELHAGGAPMSGQIARKVLAAFRQMPHFTPGPAKLSPAEIAVLQRLARGLLYKEVAEEMGLAQGTVRTHIHHIYRKLQVHNRTEAVLKGLSPPGG